MTEPTPPPAPEAPPAPAWRPPRDLGGDRASIIGGLILIGVGIWYVLDVTLGLTMPRIAWGELWPLAIIAVGLIVLARSRQPA